jgi:hypothetical protein
MKKILFLFLLISCQKEKEVMLKEAELSYSVKGQKWGTGANVGKLVPDTINIEKIPIVYKSVKISYNSLFFEGVRTNEACLFFDETEKTFLDPSYFNFKLSNVRDKICRY